MGVPITFTPWDYKKVIPEEHSTMPGREGKAFKVLQMLPYLSLFFTTALIWNNLELHF